MKRLIVAVLVSLCAMTGTAAAVTGPLVPSSGTLFGSFVKTRAGRTHAQELAYVEKQAGRKFDIDHFYHVWGDIFPNATEKASASSGHTLFVNLKPNAAWSKIASGGSDAYLGNLAGAIHAFDKPLFLSFQCEMDRMTSFGTPSAYIAAYKHLRTVFANHGAGNVVWVWCVTAAGLKTGHAQQYYPGDSLVSWIASDGYNWFPSKPWREFSDVYSLTEHFCVLHAKPCMAGETGTQEDKSQPGRKGRWFAGAESTMKQWPNFKAFVYFNSNPKYNWFIDTSSTSLSGFRQLATDPYYSPAVSR